MQQRSRTATRIDSGHNLWAVRRHRREVPIRVPRHVFCPALPGCRLSAAACQVAVPRNSLMDPEKGPHRAMAAMPWIIRWVARASWPHVTPL